MYGLRMSALPGTLTPGPRHVKRVATLLDTLSQYARSVLSGIADYADRQERWEVIPIRTADVQGWARQLQPDGIIAEARAAPVREALSALGVPVVTVMDRPYGLPAVLPDNIAIGALGARYLLGLGFSQIAFCGAARSGFGQQRCRGFQTEAEEAGGVAVHVYDDEVVIAAPGTESANFDTRLRDWLRSLPKPVGVMAANDTMALTVARACRAGDLLVPEMVAILGVDNDELICRLNNPSLSSIDAAGRRIGATAAELLDKLMEGVIEPAGQVVEIQPLEVAQRRSTDTLAIADADVAAAVRFIREHDTQPLRVSQVVEQVAVGRRKLEMQFRRSLNRTIRQEIARARIARVRHLLLHTDLDLAQVAEVSGFRYPSRLCAEFRRHMGQSPAAYRRRARNR
jgi:LacI family transcriptional regulator